MQEAQIRPPLHDVRLNEDNTVSFFQLRRLFYFHHDTAHRCAVRSQWNTALETTRSAGTVSFGEIQGCLSSKSHVTDFLRMLDHPKSSANVRFHINAYTDRVEELADKVLNGTTDYAVAKGKPAEIMQQAWDNRMWLANSGGSHRSAAVWHLDRAHGHERILPAVIDTHSISADFQALCTTHSIWMFKPDKPAALHAHKAAFKGSGLLLSQQEVTPIEPIPQDWCLIVPKSDPRHAQLQSLMTNAFDLSEWVNQAHAKPAPVAAPASSPSRQSSPEMS